MSFFVVFLFWKLLRGLEKNDFGVVFVLRSVCCWASPSVVIMMRVLCVSDAPVGGATGVFDSVPFAAVGAAAEGGVGFAAGGAAACRSLSVVAVAATRKFHLIKSINFKKDVLGG